MNKIGIGLAGFGTVGTGVYRQLSRNRVLIIERLGLELKIRRIAVRNPCVARPINPPTELMTSRWEDLIDDPNVDIVIELMGGVDTSFQFVTRALDAGKVVITGNKALLAERGAEIFEHSSRQGVPVFFEAAVAGGIPIIKSIREGFVGNHIQAIHAILNGTSNYILTRMTEEGIEFPDALKEAQQLGYAEADPTLDVKWLGRGPQSDYSCFACLWFLCEPGPGSCRRHRGGDFFGYPFRRSSRIQDQVGRDHPRRPRKFS
jgi:homoserine dehydrogenase